MQSTPDLSFSHCCSRPDDVKLDPSSTSGNICAGTLAALEPIARRNPAPAIIRICAVMLHLVEST
jgi:hypothetical protein